MESKTFQQFCRSIQSVLRSVFKKELKVSGHSIYFRTQLSHSLASIDPKVESVFILSFSHDRNNSIINSRNLSDSRLLWIRGRNDQGIYMDWPKIPWC